MAGGVNVIEAYSFDEAVTVVDSQTPESGPTIVSLEFDHQILPETIMQELACEAAAKGVRLKSAAGAIPCESKVA